MASKTAKKATANKAAAPAKTKAAPAKRSGKDPFATIDPLPWAQRPLPSFAVDERAAQLLALGYPHLFLTAAGDFSGSDEKLLKQIDDTRIVPRDALARVYALKTYEEMVPTDLTKAVAEILKQAPALGHRVTAFARSNKLSDVTVVTGSVLDEIAVTNAIRGHDAVPSCLGTRPWRHENICSEGVRVIAKAMQTTGRDLAVSCRR